MYTMPWVAETKTFRLIPREEVLGWYEKMTDLKGWYGLMEEICVPVDEVDNFNRRVRDPAGRSNALKKSRCVLSCTKTV